MGFRKFFSWAMVAVLAAVPFNWLRLWIGNELTADATVSSFVLGTLICWGLSAGLGYFLVMSAKGTRIAERRRAAVAEVSAQNLSSTLSKPAAFHWDNGGNFDCEVVGESFYQSHLASLARADEWADERYTATLLPEDENPHDKMAVSVYIGARQVGHLSRDDARSFRRRLSAKGLSKLPTTCDASIRGGGIINGKQALYGVWLDMKPFK